MGMNLVQLEKDLREVFERENLQKDEINRLGRLNQKFREENTIMEDQLLQNATWLEEKTKLVDVEKAKTAEQTKKLNESQTKL